MSLSSHDLINHLVFSYQSNTAKDVLDTILNIQPKDSSAGGGETRESIVRRQADDMLSKLPSDYIPHEVHTVYSSYTYNLSRTRALISLVYYWS